MADMDVTIAVEAVNNARGPLAEAAAQLEQLEGAIRRVSEAGASAGPFGDLLGGAGGSLPALPEQAPADAGMEAHALLAEAATNAALALQAEAAGLSEANFLLQEGLAARLAVSETMTALEAQTLAYQMGLLAATAAGRRLGIETQAAAQSGVARLKELNASIRAVAASFAAATYQAQRLRSAILSMANVRVRASVHVSGIGGQAAGGGEFITSGPALLVVGDNPGGRERVSVEPLSGRGQTRIAPGGGLVRAAGGIGATRRPPLPGEGALRIVVPVMLDGVEVGRGAIEGTLEALQQRGLVEEALGG